MNSCKVQWATTFACMIPHLSLIRWFCSVNIKSFTLELSDRLFSLQVSRSIGDVYLKKAEYNREPLYTKFRLREPFKRPILSSEPSITVLDLQPHDQFLIFASDGLWEHFSNQEAVSIVQNHPRNVRCWQKFVILILCF